MNWIWVDNSSYFVVMIQKKKGSILLYVLFLTSFLILFFAGFQKEIEKTLQKTIATENSVRDQSTIEDALVWLKGHPAVSAENLPSDISLTSVDYSLTSLLGSLGYNETREYWITAAGWGPLGLTISEWWPIFYRLAAFNSGAESSATIIGSGLVSSTSSILLGLTDRHILTIESLAGQTKYAITKNGASIMASSNFYSLLNSINGSTKSEEIVEVVNFVPKSYPGINYMKLGMYLKQE